MSHLQKCLYLNVLFIWIGMWSSAAQQTLRWIEYTNTWRYDQSGADLGTGWKEPDFDDSTWATGAGLFGYETNMPPPYPVPLNTPLNAGPDLVTYYFRTTFTLEEVPSALVALQATVYADDGCVVYLNGLEVGLARIGSNPAYNTRAAGGASYEGFADSMSLDPSALRSGRNVLAVELHQSPGVTYDVVFGLKLRGTVAEPIVVTSQPVDRTVVVGQSHTLSVEIAGGPAMFQWYKDNAVLTGATNRTLTLTSVSASQAGVYYLVASNLHGARVSETARLTVQEALPTGPLDRTGPRIVRCQGASALVDVTFDEAIASTTASSFILQSLDDESVVPLANLLQSGRVVRLRLTGENWRTNGAVAYRITVNGVRDTSPARNVIAPNSQMGVEFTWQQAVVPTNGSWSYHAFILDDPSLLESQWYSPEYAPSEFWRTGAAPFASLPGSDVTCTGLAMTIMPFQMQPILFRTMFTNDGLTSATLVLSGVTPAGVVFYLNGEEIRREGVAAFPTALTVDTRATAAGISCSERRIPNVRLRPGTNYLACAVFQYASGTSFDPGSSSAQFGLAATLEYSSSPTLPVSAPRLESAMVPGLAPSNLRLSWLGGGFALESTTNLNLGSASYPYGPWLEVTNMSNPYTNPVTAPAQYFRLKK